MSTIRALTNELDKEPPPLPVTETAVESNHSSALDRLQETNYLYETGDSKSIKEGKGG